MTYTPSRHVAAHAYPGTVHVYCCDGWICFSSLRCWARAGIAKCAVRSHSPRHGISDQRGCVKAKPPLSFSQVRTCVSSVIRASSLHVAVHAHPDNLRVHCVDGWALLASLRCWTRRYVSSRLTLANAEGKTSASTHSPAVHAHTDILRVFCLGG